MKYKLSIDAIFITSNLFYLSDYAGLKVKTQILKICSCLSHYNTIAAGQNAQSLLGGAVPGKAACGGLVGLLLVAAAAWPGMEYWGLNWAKLVPYAPGN